MIKIIPAATFLLSALAISSCKGNSCMQNVESWHVFLNTTGAAHSLSLVVSDHKKSGPEQKTISLSASADAQNFLLHAYSYEKDPAYRGKVDFSPEDADCSVVERRDAAFQLTDPATATVKLCFQIENGDSIYVVDKTTACPADSKELQRW